MQKGDTNQENPLPLEQNRHPGKQWNREFLVNVIFLISINLLIKPFYLFGIDRVVQNTVAPGEYGLYFALFNFTFLFQIINDFGIQYFNNRHLAGENLSLDTSFPLLLILKGILSLIYFVVLLAAAWLWNYPVNYFHLLLLLGLNQVLVSLIQFIRSNLSGLGYYRVDSIFSVLDKVLMILICGALLWLPIFKGSFRIEWFVVAQSFSLLLTAIISFAFVFRQLSGRLQFHWQPELLKTTIRESAPYALIVFLMILYTRIDGIMIERMLPDGKIEADLYASAYRLLDAGNMIGVLFSGLLFPMFARIIKEQTPVFPLMNLSFQLLWSGAISLAVGTIFFRQAIMEALYHSGGPYSGQILGFLMLSFLAISGTYVFGTLLGAKGALKKMNMIALVGLSGNILLNLLFIPTYKALGAAAVTCITQAIVFIAQVMVVHREFKLDASMAMWGRILGFSILVIAFCLVMKEQVGGPWFIRYIGGISGSLLLAFVFRLIDLSQLKEIWLKR